MNLSKLFEMQRKLDERIVREKGLEGQNLLDKKILAFQVELGELANEWRGFKYWSKNQEPRTVKYIENRKHRQNPLLEEYVDCLHFILSIGIEINIDVKKCKNLILSKKMPSVLDQFMWTNYKITKLYETYRDIGKDQMAYDYVHLFNALIDLGEMLGFTPEQVESAYYEKNAENHRRQEVGY